MSYWICAQVDLQSGESTNEDIVDVTLKCMNKELGLAKHIVELDIDRVHRLGPRRGAISRPILVKFATHRARQLVYRNLPGGWSTFIYYNRRTTTSVDQRRPHYESRAAMAREGGKERRKTRWLLVFGRQYTGKRSGGVISQIRWISVFDWSSSVTYVLTDWTFLTILYSTGSGNEAMWDT